MAVKDSVAPSGLKSLMTVVLFIHVRSTMKSLAEVALISPIRSLHFQFRVAWLVSANSPCPPLTKDQSKVDGALFSICTTFAVSCEVPGKTTSPAFLWNWVPHRISDFC